MMEVEHSSSKVTTSSKVELPKAEGNLNTSENDRLLWQLTRHVCSTVHRMMLIHANI